MHSEHFILLSIVQDDGTMKRSDALPLQSTYSFAFFRIMMELLLFLCVLISVLLLCLMMVGALLLCLLVETAVLLQMYRTLTQPTDANKYHICRH